jgi:potassium-transporting ATPase ATP-binding subunit
VVKRQLKKMNNRINKTKLNESAKLVRRKSRKASLTDPLLMSMAIKQAFKMLLPWKMARNPVMFITEIGAFLTLLVVIEDIISHSNSILYSVAITLILWITVLFANFAEALAEVRGKSQAATLRQTRHNTIAKRLTVKNTYEEINSDQLMQGDIVIVYAGEIIPGDGEVIEGAASVDESAITGESAPVIREAGGDRSGVTGGTTLLSDKLKIQITSSKGDSFLDKMIALVEGATRQKTPNELALTVTLAGLTLAFLIVIGSLWFISQYFKVSISIPTMIALLVCLIPTTIGALLAAIGLAGMDRALSANVLAKSGKAVELAGDIDTILLDKTGTITIGNRQATNFYPLNSVPILTLIEASLLASFGDNTPEGKSINKLGLQMLNKISLPEHNVKKVIPFSAQTRISGIDTDNNISYRKGAPDTMQRYLLANDSIISNELTSIVDMVANKGCTPLVVAENKQVLGVIELSDVLKTGIKERFARLRAMGLRVIMVTGDNELTAKAIAKAAGVDGYIAEAKPEDKLNFIRNEQHNGHLIAMMGDGTNDSPALAQADIGVAMNSGTQAAKEAANMVDLDSDPTKLLEVIEIGKQLLMTRGALTTFSIANDVAKYFAIIPAMFMLTIPELSSLNIMQLSSPNNAILSALIFNALIIPALIPIAIKGVKFRPVGADKILQLNLLIYGLGGLILPFIGIKLIDLTILFITKLIG